MAIEAQTYRAVQAVAPGKLELTEKPLTDPGPGYVRIRVQACGICHSDAATVDGILPIEWPRVPGNELVGVIDGLGEGVQGWSVGQRCRRRVPRWQLWSLQTVPGWRSRALRESRIHGCSARWWLCGGHDREGDRVGFRSRRSLLCRRCALIVCWDHHVWWDQEHFRQSGGPCRDPWDRRPRASRDPVRAPHGVRSGRDWTRQGQGGARQETWRTPLHRQQRGELWRRATGNGRRCVRGLDCFGRHGTNRSRKRSFARIAATPHPLSAFPPSSTSRARTSTWGSSSGRIAPPTAPTRGIAATSAFRSAASARSMLCGVMRPHTLPSRRSRIISPFTPTASTRSKNV